MDGLEVTALDSGRLIRDGTHFTTGNTGGGLVRSRPPGPAAPTTPAWGITPAAASGGNVERLVTLVRLAAVSAAAGGRAETEGV